MPNSSAMARCFDPVDNLAVLVLNDGRMDALNPNGVSERVPLLRVQWRQQAFGVLRNRLIRSFHYVRRQNNRFLKIIYLIAYPGIFSSVWQQIRSPDETPLTNATSKIGHEVAQGRNKPT